MKILIGTGYVHTDIKLRDVFSDKSSRHSIEKPFISVREQLLTDELDCDILILAETLDGLIPFPRLFKLIKDKYPNLRVIFLTKSLESKNLGHFLLSGYTDFVDTPFTVNELFHAIENPNSKEDVEQLKLRLRLLTLF